MRAVALLVLIAATEPLCAQNSAARAYAERALQAHRAADSTTALALYDSAVAADSTFALAYHRRGMLRVSLHVPGGVVDISRAIELDPNLAAALFVRASIRLNAGDTSRATEDLRRAAALGHEGAQRALARLPRLTRVEPGVLGGSLPRAHLNGLGALGIVLMFILTAAVVRSMRSTQAEFVPRQPERELWSDLPGRFGVSDMVAFWFGVPMLIVGLLWLREWRRNGDENAQALGILLTSIGIVLVVVRTVWKVWQRSRTSYAVTTERVIQFTGNATRWVQLLGAHLTLDHERSDGSGTMLVATSRDYVRLEHIPDVAGVYALIQAQQKTLASDDSVDTLGGTRRELRD